MLSNTIVVSTKKGYKVSRAFNLFKIFKSINIKFFIIREYFFVPKAISNLNINNLSEKRKFN